MVCYFFVSSRRRHTRCAVVTGVQTCALPICEIESPTGWAPTKKRSTTTVIAELRVAVAIHGHTTGEALLARDAMRGQHMRDAGGDPLAGGDMQEIGRASWRDSVLT